VSSVVQERLFPLRVDETKLGSNQQDVLARIDRYGSVRVREAGRIVYINRGVRDPSRLPKEWLAAAGFRVLISLRRRGLVRCSRDGLWLRKPQRGLA
jgi:hypothetical protein